MPRRKRREWILDIVVGLAALFALFLVVRERVIPWVAERSVLDPGETVTVGPSLVDAETGDSISLPRGTPHLLLVFRSTCPTCERAVPAWNRLSRRGAWMTTAIGLESPEAAARYAGERLPDARAAVPRDIERFATRFRIDVVPTTLVIDRGGRLVARRAGPLEDSDIETLPRHVETSAP
jgi:thiol-disulfide isomerase/thioredoxin